MTNTEFLQSMTDEAIDHMMGSMRPGTSVRDANGELSEVEKAFCAPR